jgi:hypothetical protein
MFSAMFFGVEDLNGYTLGIAIIYLFKTTFSTGLLIEAGTFTLITACFHHKHSYLKNVAGMERLKDHAFLAQMFSSHSIFTSTKQLRYRPLSDLWSTVEDIHLAKN